MFDSPANHDLLSVVKGARNGFVYGVKIREYASKHAVSRILIEYRSHPGFPHALVMTFLFSHKPCISIPLQILAMF